MDRDDETEIAQTPTYGPFSLLTTPPMSARQTFTGRLSFLASLGFAFRCASALPARPARSSAIARNGVTAFMSPQEVRAHPSKNRKNVTALNRGAADHPGRRTQEAIDGIHILHVLAGGFCGRG